MTAEILSTSPESPGKNGGALTSPRSPTNQLLGAQALPGGAHAALPTRTVVRENPMFHMDDDIINVFGGGGDGGHCEVSWVSSSSGNCTTICTLFYKKNTCFLMHALLLL